MEGIRLSKDYMNNKVNDISKSVMAQYNRCLVLFYLDEGLEKAKVDLVFRTELPLYVKNNLQRALKASNTSVSQMLTSDVIVQNLSAHRVLFGHGGRFHITINGKVNVDSTMIVLPIKSDSPDERLIEKFRRDKVWLAYYTAVKAEQLESTPNGEYLSQSIRTMKLRRGADYLRDRENLLPFRIYDEAWYGFDVNGEGQRFCKGYNLQKHLIKRLHIGKLVQGLTLTINTTPVDRMVTAVQYILKDNDITGLNMDTNQGITMDVVLQRYTNEDMNNILRMNPELKNNPEIYLE